MSIFSAPGTWLTSNCLYEMFSKINALFNSCYRYFVYKSSLKKHNVGKILPFYTRKPLNFSYLTSSPSFISAATDDQTCMQNKCAENQLNSKR